MLGVGFCYFPWEGLVEGQHHEVLAIYQNGYMHGLLVGELD